MSRHPQGNDLAGKLKVLFAFAVAVATCGAARAVADVDVAAAETGFGTGETDVSDGRWPHFSLHAAADIESAYICRGYVWDRRPYSAQSVDGTVGLGPFGRADVYLWSMSALSGEGHSTPMRRAYNEVDYGLRYFYDIALAEEWTLVNGVARQWVTNPGVRHGGHSFIDWWAMQTLKNPYLTPYWRMRYSRHPYQAVYWCVGAKHAFDLTDDLSLTIDLSGDLGDARTEMGLFGPKPGAPTSRYHGGLHALNLVFRLDYRVTDYLNLFAFVGQYGLVMDDARAAVKASSAREATRDLTYAGIGLELDF